MNNIRKTTLNECDKRQLFHIGIYMSAYILWNCMNIMYINNEYLY